MRSGHPAVCREGLLIEALGAEELVVLDRDTGTAFALSGPVASVFDLCSGERSVEGIAGELGVPVSVVGEALVELERYRLLESPIDEAQGWATLMDRRGVLVAGAALSVPLIVSAVLPAAAAAVSGTHAELTPVSGSPFPTGAHPESVAFAGGTPGSAIDPLLLATGNVEGNTVSMFTVGASGALTQVSGSPYATGSEPYSIGFGGGTPGSITDPLLLATANTYGSTVSVFTVGTTGALTSVSGSPYAFDQPLALAFSGGTPGSATDPLLLAVADDTGLSVFTVDTSGGLTEVPGSPFPADLVVVGFSGGTPGSATDPLLLAGANQSDGTVSMFTVGATGSLTPVSGSPYPVGSGPHGVAFSNGTPGSATDPLLLTTANATANTVSVFTVDISGELTQVAGSPYPTDEPFSVAFGGGTPGSVSDPLLLAVCNLFSNTVSVFSVDASGALTPVTGSPFTTDELPAAVAFGGGTPGSATDPLLLATANAGASTVSVFTVG